MSHVDVPHCQTQFNEPVTDGLHTFRIRGESSTEPQTCPVCRVLLTSVLLPPVRRLHEETAQVPVPVCFGNAHLQRSKRNALTLVVETVPE